MTTQSRVTINVMAPLVVGNPADPNNEASKAAWEQFDKHLAEIKTYGVDGVSTDVWWGLVETSENVYDWSFYDRLSDHIIAAGLKWIPILSFHQCGGNIGDDCYVPLPSWLWTKLSGKVPSGKAAAVKFVSEQGNECNEYVSFWATDLVLDDYVRLMKAFQEHFAAKVGSIAEINVSLGPSGELRYPAYNKHDKGTDWPNRGALQCYSELASASFSAHILAKYTDEAGVEKAWGKPVTDQGQPIKPPKDASRFFANNDHLNTQYGRDLVDWYADSLITHGRKVMTAALEVFAADDASFKGIDLGAKIPGIHWRIGNFQGETIVLADRLAELPAGLIRTSGKDWGADADGRGYRTLLGLFKDLQQVRPASRVVLHFTCLEMPDGDGGHSVASLAHQLVLWVGQEAQRQGIPIKGENALAWNLPKKESWQLMRSVLAAPGQNGAYQGLTILRMADILANGVCKSELAATMSFIQPPAAKAV